ncbi:MAG: glycosyltransferase family 4 protein [Candidatus Brocadiae bacterium]|nr:glycosyltransferase family 4 protein [Candidatus Brocadiia bacterium]
MKILISAYACEPGRGSEPGVGWNAALQAARRHDVWLLTRSGNRAAIESGLRILPDGARIRVCPVADPRSGCLVPAGRSGKWIDYGRWQVAALDTAEELHRTVGFDLIHHVTFASWRVPTRLYELPVPVIWGPLGGGSGVPRGFGSVLGFQGRFSESFREASQYVSRRLPGVGRCARKCRLVLAANGVTRDFLSPLCESPPPVLCEMGVEIADFPERSPRPAHGGPLRIFWSGVFEPRKALPLLLGALTHPEAPDCTLDIAGDGPERERWRRAAARMNVEGRVRFHGRLVRHEALRLLEAADVFVFTSLRETTGWVLVEAMAAACPVVALDWSGTPDVLPAEAGIRIRPESPAQVRDGLARALARLSADPDLRVAMGKAGRAHVARNLTWDRYGAEMDRYYREFGGAR